MTTAGPASRAATLALLAVSAAVFVPPAVARTSIASDGSSTQVMEEPRVRIVAVLLNPTAEGDAGEHVVVEFAAPTDATGWTVDDGESAVVGSVNWNAYATRENREVAVVLHDREAAAHYGRVFRADWRVGLAAALVGAAAAVRTGRTVRFDGSSQELAAVDYEVPPGGEPGNAIGRGGR